MQLIGQKNNLDIINKWNTLPQFLIIQGDSYTGKTSLVLYLCQKYNVHYIKMNNSINSVRGLLSSMVKDSNTLYHFKDFDKASIQAKNALLKITEEPVPGNYIVITGSAQLKTLESRARRIIMEPYNDFEVKQYMTQYYESSIIQDLYKCGINTPGKAYQYREYEHIKQLCIYVKEIFEKITHLTVDDIIVMLGRFEIRYENLDACLLFLNMLINYIDYNIRTKHYYSYYAILQILIEGKTSLVKEPTLNRKFLLYRIFYNIYLLRGQI